MVPESLKINNNPFKKQYNEFYLLGFKTFENRKSLPEMFNMKLLNSTNAKVFDRKQSLDFVSFSLQMTPKVMELDSNAKMKESPMFGMKSESKVSRKISLMMSAEPGLDLQACKLVSDQLYHQNPFSEVCELRLEGQKQLNQKVNKKKTRSETGEMNLDLLSVKSRRVSQDHESLNTCKNSPKGKL